MNYYLVNELLGRLAIITTENLRLTQEKKELQFIKESLEHDLTNDLLNLSNIAQFSIQNLNEVEQKNRFEQYQNRLLAMIDFYRLLLTNQESKTIDIREFAIGLCSSICKKYQRLDIDFKVYSDVKLYRNKLDRKLQRIIGDVLSELTQNMLKHAFPKKITAPTAQIKIKRLTSSQILLEYQDNGIGFSTNSNANTSQGLSLLKVIAQPNALQFGNNSTGGAFVKLQIGLT